jgi:hypothetical protein
MFKFFSSVALQGNKEIKTEAEGMWRRIKNFEASPLHLLLQ